MNTRCWHNRFCADQHTNPHCPNEAQWQSGPDAIHARVGWVWCSEHKHDGDVRIGTLSMEREPVSDEVPTP